MKPLFADASLFIAHFVPSEPFHPVARHYLRNHAGPVVTTTMVLAEFANFMAESRARPQVAPFLHDLRTDPRFDIVLPDAALFWDAVDLYASRTDKEWGLIDCLSFLVMQRRGITEALSADHHFEQAGFTILLK